MLSVETAVEILRALPQVSEKEHFKRNGFWANKRMFATVDADRREANVRLSPDDQHEFLECDSEIFQEIKNKWGTMGWTTVVLEFIDRAAFQKVAVAALEYSREKVKVDPAFAKAKAAEKKAAEKAKTTDKPPKPKIRAKSAFKKGAKIEWKWIGSRAEGVVVEVYAEPVTMTIKGKKITRKGSPAMPAYLVRSKNGGVALKLESELLKPIPKRGIARK